MWECLNHPWIFPRIPDDILLRQSNEINMDNLRNYQARKRWKVGENGRLSVRAERANCVVAALHESCLPLQQTLPDQAQRELAGSPGSSRTWSRGQ